MSRPYAARWTAALPLVANLALAAGPPAADRALFADTDTLRIEAQALLDLDAGQLQLAINEIYARACHAFKDPGLAARLGGLARGCAPGAPRGLTPTEQANAMLLRRFQTYLRQYPDGFEATYRIVPATHAEGVAMRACPEAKCSVIGHLQAGCSVTGDFRMDEMRGRPEWIYVRSSRCAGAEGPAGGFIPQSALKLVAG